MSHAPECDGPIYGCRYCGERGLTIEGMLEHECSFADLPPHNCQLKDLSVGCTVRSYRRSKSAWVIERIENGRAYLRCIYDVNRTADLSLATSMWAISWPRCDVDDMPFVCNVDESAGIEW